MSIDAVEMLEAAARGGAVDYSKWPEILQFIFPTLEQIIKNDFPAPKIPIPGSSSLPSSMDYLRDVPDNTPSGSPKTTIIPATPQPPSGRGTTAATTTPANLPSTSSPSVIPNSQPMPPPPPPSSSSAAITTPSGSLPPPLLTLYTQIQRSLRGPWQRLPPYTFQRLAELILRPRAHYATLPAYLRALDKVLSVSSTADVYPLPVPPDVVQAREQANGEGGLGGGGGTSYLAPSRESRSKEEKEGFNGAELTRIPWLRDSAEDSDGEDGEDVDAPGEPLGEVNPQQYQQERTTQIEGSQLGESAALGQEHEASPDAQTTLIPVNGLEHGSVAADAPSAARLPVNTVAMAPATSAAEALVRDEERGNAADIEDGAPHARGPQEIGNEDIGLQHTENEGMPGLVNLEAAMGRPGEGEVVPGSSAQVPEDRVLAGSQETGNAEKAENDENAMAVDDRDDAKEGGEVTKESD